MIKVGFTGTQKGLEEKQLKTLEIVLVTLMPGEVHHGDCIGADTQCHQIIRRALQRTKIIIHPPINIDKREFNAGDDTYQPKGYLNRNDDIVKSSNVVIGCPETKKMKIRSGTWYTIRQAIRQKVPVLIIYPDGTTEKR